LTLDTRIIDKCNTANRQVNPSELVCRGSSPDYHNRSCRYTALTHRDVVNLDELARLRSAWVDLLNRYNWDWFATLTFRDLPKSFTAVNRVKKWLTAIQRDEKRLIGYFMATEWFKTQECLHFHRGNYALLKGVSLG